MVEVRFCKPGVAVRFCPGAPFRIDMIKLIATIGTPITQDTNLDKKTERTAIFKKYKSQGKILADFVLLNDSVIEISFIDLTSAQAFATEMQALYIKYNDLIEITYI